MKQIPDAITKRDILHGSKKLTLEEKHAIGDRLKQIGWLSDSIDFVADDAPKLTALKAALIEEGNVFLLLKVFRLLNDENRDELVRASAKAEELGKIRYALKGYEKLDLPEKVESLKALIANDGDQKSALNSVFIPKTEEEREEVEDV